jgi:hypothetical protein
MNEQVPVLLVIFNRPEKTRRVIDSLRMVKPEQIFIAADGPRDERSDDNEKCSSARQVVGEIDWPCSLQTRFLDKNLGCDPSVSSAISWFFEHVHQGVILEDDCIPHPDFFRFSSEMLERYKDDKRIMQVSGLSPYPERDCQYDYHFSGSFRCWGWGTWRRAWSLYSDSLEQYDKHIKQILPLYYPIYAGYLNRLNLYRVFRQGERDNWDFKWNIACYAQNALSVVPEKNLMANIGFDKEGTHTLLADPFFANLKTNPIAFPLRHPPFVFADRIPEQNLSKNIFSNLPIKSKLGLRFRHIAGSLKDCLQTLPGC